MFPIPVLLRFHHIIRWFPCVSALAIGACACVAAVPRFAAPDAWVDRIETAPVTLPVTPPDDAVYGVDYLLWDQQVHLGEEASYHHTVYRIVNGGSLQSGSRLTWNFDPSCENLTIHHLRVIRNGHVQDRLDPARIQVIRQETDLDRHLLNGRLTALIHLDDVRVGDVLDFASTVHGSNPVFGGRWFDSLGVGWPTPVRHRRARVIVPDGRELLYVEHGTTGLRLDKARGHGSLAGTTVLTWEGRDLPAISYETDAPGWFVQWPFVQLGEFHTWADVVDWATPLYAQPDPVPATIREQAELLTTGLTSEDSRIVALLQFVQQDIRYLGFELGEGTHRPTPPAEVLARRFGDCKDKSVLLCALLRASGITAYPALLHTTWRSHVADWAPSPLAFNHVIVAIPKPAADGARGRADYWWVDPTLTFQAGDLEHHALPYYQTALVIRPGEDGLSDVIPPDRGRGAMTIITVVDVLASRYWITIPVEEKAKQIGQVWGAVVTTCIWVPYMYMSQQVKETFTLK
ncbi:hypothetical protein OPIT5_23045 [Opitutaceae bacterium TAV5]|nr:hypothetical protein OPIT5_23045 [Opitutaceae bacterium TAV5]